MPGRDIIKEKKVAQDDPVLQTRCSGLLGMIGVFRARLERQIPDKPTMHNELIACDLARKWETIERVVRDTCGDPSLPPIFRGVFTGTPGQRAHSLACVERELLYDTEVQAFRDLPRETKLGPDDDYTFVTTYLGQREAVKKFLRKQCPETTGLFRFFGLVHGSGDYGFGKVPDYEHGNLDETPPAHPHPVWK